MERNRMSIGSAELDGFVPPCGMGTQVQGKTIRSVTVMKYEQKGKPTLWWVEDFRDNGKVHTVFPCTSLDDAQECYSEVLKES
jgi:hypothetical protein